MGLFHRQHPPHAQREPVSGASLAAPALVTLFAALGWWLDGEGVRDFTIVETPLGGVFVKGMRPRLNYRATATEVVTEHFDAARLGHLINDYRHAVSQGDHGRHH